jgi:hypothetical protein
MCFAAAHVVGRLQVASARTAAALLIPGLSGRLAHLPAPLGLVRALALPRPAQPSRLFSESCSLPGEVNEARETEVNSSE